MNCQLAFADPMAEDEIPPAPSPAFAEPALNPQVTAELLTRDKPLVNIQATIRAPQGELPSRVGVSRVPEPPVFGYPYGNPRYWIGTSFDWDAPCTRNLPLYFEDPNLERLGYTQRWYCDRFCRESNPNIAELIQPVISGAQFVGTIPLLPIMMIRRDPLEPVYTLGVDRPGTPVCYREYRSPYWTFPPRAPVADTQ